MIDPKSLADNCLFTSTPTAKNSKWKLRYLNYLSMPQNRANRWRRKSTLPCSRSLEKVSATPRFPAPTTPRPLSSISMSGNLPGSLSLADTPAQPRPASAAETKQSSPRGRERRRRGGDGNGDGDGDGDEMEAAERVASR